MVHASQAILSFVGYQAGFYLACVSCLNTVPHFISFQWEKGAAVKVFETRFEEGKKTRESCPRPRIWSRECI